MNLSPLDVLSPTDAGRVREKRMAVEIALRDARIAELELFVRYGMGEEDTFNAFTGEITRAAKAFPES
jgi:hypothetical protein